MTVHAWLLLFIIYRTDDDHAAEPGHVIARSCAAAEQFVLDGRREGQAVLFGECTPYREGTGW